MKDYKRLTQWETSKGVKCVKYWQYSQEEIAERLALLEDMIENGTLVKKTCKKVQTKVDYMPYFEYLWKMYPRKVGKQNAIKQFEKKIRGLTVEEVKNISNKIYILLKKRIAFWQEQETEICYIPHFSSLLNAEIPNSKHYKGR